MSAAAIGELFDTADPSNVGYAPTHELASVLLDRWRLRRAAELLFQARARASRLPVAAAAHSALRCAVSGQGSQRLPVRGRAADGKARAAVRAASSPPPHPPPAVHAALRPQRVGGGCGHRAGNLGHGP